MVGGEGGLASQVPQGGGALPHHEGEIAVIKDFQQLDKAVAIEAINDDEIDLVGDRTTHRFKMQGPSVVGDDSNPTPEHQTKQQRPDPAPNGSPAIDLPPGTLEESPVLRRWLQEVPNVLEDIRNDPAFRTRARLGYSTFPSTDGASGFHVGIEDVFVGRTRLTVSGEYQRTFGGSAAEVARTANPSTIRYRQTYGGDLRYYIFPLGSLVNAAPVLGYRRIETSAYSTDGVNVGLRLVLNLSRTGAADVALTQSWVSPGSTQEVGITTLSFGYAVTRRLRLSTDFQRQNAPRGKDSRVGISLEWML